MLKTTKFYKLKASALALLCSILFNTAAVSIENAAGARENYLRLNRMYDKWNSGLFGSRKLYRNRLNRLLIEMIGTEIHTGRDYRISVPDVFEKKYYSSDLYNYNWLIIHGPADDSSIKVFAEKGSDYIKEVEINKDLFFLSGRILKFRIAESSYGRAVHLYLDAVKITETIK